METQGKKLGVSSSDESVFMARRGAGTDARGRLPAMRHESCLTHHSTVVACSNVHATQALRICFAFLC